MSTMTITHSPVLSKTVFQSPWNADAYSSPVPEIGFLRLFDDNFVVGFGEAQNSTPRIFIDASAEKTNTYNTPATTHATPSPEAASQTQYLAMPPPPKLPTIPLPAFDDEEYLFYSLGGGEPMEVDTPGWPAAFSVHGPSTFGLSDTESEASAQGEMREISNALELTHLSPHKTSF